MARKKKSNWDNMEPQKSSAAQFLTYVASVGNVDERYEIRYEDENIWMSQKMLAAVYGVEVPNIAYHLRKLFADAELDKSSVIKEILITADDGKKYSVNHYNLQVIIALGFKIDNERAVQFRKWANRIVGDYTIRGYVMDKERFKNGSPLSNEYFEHLLEDIREIRLSERKFYQKVTDLYATAVDYDGTALRTRRFFATVQNKMHRVVNGLSAAQIIYSRADAEKEQGNVRAEQRNMCFSGEIDVRITAQQPCNPGSGQEGEKNLRQRAEDSHFENRTDVFFRELQSHGKQQQRHADVRQ